MELKTILLISTSLLILVGLSTQFYFSASASAPTFDPQAAIDADYYAKVSSCDLNKIQTWTCGTSCQKHKNVEDVQAFSVPVTEVQGYCAYDPDANTIVVAYRGSSNIPNWIADFVYTPVAYSDCVGCKVHVGFKTALASVSYIVNPCVASLLKKHPTAHALVTGHSLGGALATLSVLEVAKIVDPSRVKFINFGAPRVGNQQFVDYFMSIIPNGRRVVNFRDIVPHLPLQTMGFKHVNYEVWMLYDGAIYDYKVCPIEEDPSCSDSLKFYNTEDHSYYLGLIQGC